MTTRVSDIRARFEQKIAKAGKPGDDETGGMYLAARLVKQKIAKCSSTSSDDTLPTSPTNQKQSSKKADHSRPPKSPTKARKTCTYTRAEGTKNSTEFSITSRTASGSDNSDCSSDEAKPTSTTKTTTAAAAVRPPKVSPKRNTARRASICQKRFVDFPQSIDEEKEEMVGCTIVMCDKDEMEGSLIWNNLENDEACTSPRKGSVVGRMDESEQSITSRGSTLSRSSPQIRRLPRDIDFDSDNSSMSEDDSAGLAKHRQQRVRKPLPKPRYW